MTATGKLKIFPDIFFETYLTLVVRQTTFQKFISPTLDLRQTYSLIPIIEQVLCYNPGKFDCARQIQILHEFWIWIYLKSLFRNVMLDYNINQFVVLCTHNNYFGQLNWTCNFGENLATNNTWNIIITRKSLLNLQLMLGQRIQCRNITFINRLINSSGETLFIARQALQLF